MSDRFASPDNSDEPTSQHDVTRENAAYGGDETREYQAHNASDHQVNNDYADGDYSNGVYTGNEFAQGESNAGQQTSTREQPPTREHSSLMRWIAVATVAALIGAGFGATFGVGAMALADHFDSPTRSDEVSKSSSNQPATPNAIRSVLNKVQPAVVTITASGSSGQGSGTGMIVSSDGEILTNNHVVTGASQIRVTFNNDKNPRAAKLIGTDQTLDSALLKVDGVSNLPTVKFADSDKNQVGDEVVAIGNALALTGGPSVTSGIISAKDRSLSDGGTTLQNLIQTDTAINPGNSGGPLLNMSGDVVGMNTAVIRGNGGEYENIGFAIPVNSIQPVISDLRKGVNRAPGFLGLSSLTLDDEIRGRLSLTPSKGVVVSDVFQGGPASNAGLARYDVIVSVDDQEIAESQQLVNVIRAKNPGTNVTVTYYRGADKRVAKVQLGSLPSTTS